MKKTIKYYLSNEAIETMPFTDLELTKKQFNNIVKQCEAELIKSASYEYPLEKKISKYDFTTYTQTYIEYVCGCYGTILSIVECKKGYCFK